MKSRFFISKNLLLFSKNSVEAEGELSMRRDSMCTGCNGFLDFSVFQHLKSMEPFPMAVIEINEIATLLADS